MQASNFEFRQRFFVIGLIFGLGFFCYSFDQKNAAAALAQRIFGSPPESPQATHHLQLILGLAALIVAASAMLRTWAAAYLRGSVIHDMNLHTELLVADGPYRFTRNPLYLALILLAVGMGMLASRLGFLVIVAGIVLFAYRLIGREEGELLRAQGPAYRSYYDAVPRLWPSFRPRIRAGSIQPRWGEAWMSESFFWSFAASVLVTAVTLHVTWGYLIMGVSLLMYLLFNVILKRGAKGTQE
jgi:protein-S-isoprenylcysteine O-methyltransferase Ste14